MRNPTDVALVAVASPLRMKAEKRKPVIWTGTSRPTSAWLMLLSELRPAAGMSTKGFVYTGNHFLRLHNANQTLYRIGSNPESLVTIKARKILGPLQKGLREQMAVPPSKGRPSRGSGLRMKPLSATPPVLSARSNSSRPGRRTCKTGSGRMQLRSVIGFITPVVMPK